jgi:hypothetical protein
MKKDGEMWRGGDKGMGRGGDKEIGRRNNFKFLTPNSSLLALNS